MAPGLAAARPKTRVWGSSLSGRPSRPALNPSSAPIRIGPRPCLRQPRVRAPHTDKLGSTRALSNDAGAVAARYDYDAYGNPTSQTGFLQPFQFAGQYTDAESGLQYLRARYYDPTVQQFISRDPAVMMTTEPYIYAMDSPVNHKDPSGLFGWNDLQHIAKAAVTAPIAVGHSGILNVESVISAPIYAAYVASYDLNRYVWPTGPAILRAPFSGIQRGALWGDEAWDRFQQWSGYPGANENDEGIVVNYLPSIIYPSLDSNCNWQQKKFTYGPTTGSPGPGRHQDGHEDYAD